MATLSQEHGSTWLWCCHHLNHLLFGDLGFQELSAELNAVSNFLRCGNNMERIKDRVAALTRKGQWQSPTHAIVARALK